MYRSRLTAAALAFSLLIVGTLPGAGQDAAQPAPATQKARYEKVPLTFMERGHLEAAVRTDLYCRLSDMQVARPGTPYAATIRSVVPDGSQVKTGQLVLEFDDSMLREKLEAAKAPIEPARAALLVAETTLSITRAQGEADLRAAKVAGQLADLDRAAFDTGEARTAPLEKRALLLRAEAAAVRAKERADEAERQKALGKATPAQVEARRLQARAAETALEKARADLEHCLKHVLPRAQLALQAKVEETRRAAEQVERQNEVRIAHAQSEAAAKRKQLEDAQANAQWHEQELKHCRVVAPHDGIAVYHTPQQARAARGAPKGAGGPPDAFRFEMRGAGGSGGPGDVSGAIAQGEPVRAGQKLLMVCDLRRMQAHVLVPEAHVAKVRAGQTARIHMDALPERFFRGEVQSVATTASQQAFVERDQKVYAVVVNIEDNVSRLRPGMTASVSIETGKHLEKALTVPAKAVVFGRDGRSAVCFVETPQGPTERAVTVSLNTGEVAVIQDGLKEGEEVFLEPGKFHKPNKEPRFPDRGDAKPSK